jgi:hypothetical protein
MLPITEVIKMQMNNTPSQTAQRDEHPTVIVRVTDECWHAGRTKYADDTEAAATLGKSLKSLRNVRGIRKSNEAGFAVDVLVECPSLCASEDVRHAMQAIYDAAQQWMKG